MIILFNAMPRNRRSLQAKDSQYDQDRSNEHSSVGLTRGTPGSWSRRGLIDTPERGRKAPGPSLTSKGDESGQISRGVGIVRFLPWESGHSPNRRLGRLATKGRQFHHGSWTWHCSEVPEVVAFGASLVGSMARRPRDPSHHPLE